MALGFTLLGRYVDAYAVLDEALGLADEAVDRLELEFRSALFCERMGREADSKAWYASALRRSRECGDIAGEAAAMGGLAAFDMHAGEHRRAISQYEEAFARADGCGAALVAAVLKFEIGWGLSNLGMRDQAETITRETTEAFRAMDARRALQVAVKDLGNFCFWRGEFDLATEQYVAALELAREAGDTWQECRVLWNLKVARERMADVPGSKRHADEHRRVEAVLLQACDDVPLLRPGGLM